MDVWPIWGNTVRYWQARVGEWVEAKLIPASPSWNTSDAMIFAFLRKNKEESQEFRNAVESVLAGIGENPEHIEDEAADEVITIMAVLHKKGLSLEAGLQRKLPILESSDWYYNTDLGVFKRRKP